MLPLNTLKISEPNNHQAEEHNSERRGSFKSIDAKTRVVHELSKAPSSVAGDVNSERGYVLDSIVVRATQDPDLTPSYK